MKAVKITSIFYLFFFSYFFSFNTLQAERVFKPDDWDQNHHHDRHWANNRYNHNRSSLSPQLINLYTHLNYPEISYPEHVSLRKMLLGCLSDSEFVNVYNEIQTVRSCPIRSK